MKRFTGFAVLGMMIWLFAGCLNIDAPKEINVGAAPPPKADCGKRPGNYDDACAQWQTLCDRNTWLEGQVERYQKKYEDEKRKKKEVENKYDKLEDKYDDHKDKYE